jgi:hypothetical protein
MSTRLCAASLLGYGRRHPPDLSVLRELILALGIALLSFLLWMELPLLPTEFFILESQTYWYGPTMDTCGNCKLIRTELEVPTDVENVIVIGSCGCGRLTDSSAPLPYWCTWAVSRSIVSL